LESLNHLFNNRIRHKINLIDDDNLGFLDKGVAVGLEFLEYHLVFFEKGFKITGFFIKGHEVNDDAGAFDMP